MKLKLRDGSTVEAVESAIRSRFNIPPTASITLLDEQGQEVKAQSLDTGNYSVRLGGDRKDDVRSAAGGVAEKEDPPLTIAINGQRHEIAAKDVDPNWTVAEYLRYHTDWKGTKIGCGEGGCGACTVTISRWVPQFNKVVYAACTSCLVPICALDGCAITTTEGLGSSQGAKGFHAIQERIAQWNGNQCGFCTPGFVMSTYSALKESQGEGFTLSAADLELKLDGNLCRCTGYRPILQAVKTLIPEGKDLQDDLTHAEKRVKAYDSRDDPVFPVFLKSHTPRPLRFSGQGLTWLHCTELAHVYTALDQHRGVPGVRFVVANTSKGVYKDDSDRVLIDVKMIPELQRIVHTDAGLSIGAAASINRLYNAVRNTANERKANEVTSFEALARHILMIASHHVRSMGSVGGNLCMAKTRGFLSDLATILLGANASVVISSRDGRQTLSMEEFLASPDWTYGQVLESVLIPWTIQGQYYNSYKTALRPTHSHAYVNAAFNFVIDEKKKIIDKAICAFGGVMEEDKAGSHAQRAKRTEAILTGAPLNNATLKKAVNELKSEFKIEDGLTSAAYRLRLVTGFFFRFFVSLLRDSAPGPVQSAADPLPRAPARGGKQVFPSVEAGDPLPVGQAIVRPQANLFASGEALFTQDVRPARGTLYIGYVQAARAGGKVVSVDTREALAMKGVVAYIDAKDVPGTLQATYSGSPPPLPSFFVGEKIQFYGQSIGAIAAESPRIAERAARLVKVTYSDAPALVTLDDVKKAGAAAEAIIAPGAEYKRGDVEATLKKDSCYGRGTFHFGAHLHFSMEPHSSYAIPEEEGGITVYNANQWPDAVQCAVAQATTIPQNKVRIILKRCGGAFGGKLTGNIPHACVAAVAALKLKRPVAVHLNRNVDMATSGGRHDVDYEYEVACNKDGLISAIKSFGLLNAGYAQDLTWFCAASTASSGDQAYYFANWQMTTKVAWTNSPARTAMRAPGEIQGSYMIESIIEHVSAITGVPSQLIRERNMYSDAPEKKDLLVTPNKTPIQFYTVPKMWKKLKESAEVDKRFKAADEFNKQNRWKKRGLAMTPVRYFVAAFQKAALMNIYGDGTILITQGGAEMGQGLYVKVAQMAAWGLGRLLGEPLDLKLIKFADTDSNVIPNMSFTGYSTGSEGAAVAVQRCCDIFLERLKPVLEGVRKAKEEKKDDSKISWQDVVGAAKGQNIDLSAQAQFAGAGEDSLMYTNFGVAVSELDVDVITGEVELLRTDMIYDCGRSLNPAIDVGQAEGAFIMGVSNFLREKIVISSGGADHGRPISATTWKYKIAGVKDVPKVFNVEFLENKEFKKGVLSSKASGEPPLVLATSVLMAVRYAISAARKDAGLDPVYQLDCPATPEDIARACGGSLEQLVVE